MKKQRTAMDIRTDSRYRQWGYSEEEIVILRQTSQYAFTRLGIAFEDLGSVIKKEVIKLFQPREGMKMTFSGAEPDARLKKTAEELGVTLKYKWIIEFRFPIKIYKAWQGEAKKIK